MTQHVPGVGKFGLEARQEGKVQRGGVGHSVTSSRRRVVNSANKVVAVATIVACQLGSVNDELIGAVPRSSGAVRLSSRLGYPEVLRPRR